MNEQPLDPPLVLPATQEPSIVKLASTPVRSPGTILFESIWLTIVYAFVVFGTMIALFLAAFGFLWVTNRLKPASEAPLLAQFSSILLVCMLVAYTAGVVFTLIMFRRFSGRNWKRSIGLNRFPIVHLGLALLVMPAFITVSDLIASQLNRLFTTLGLGDPLGLNHSSQLNDLVLNQPIWLILMAIGIAPGIAEEFWCRGFLGSRLVKSYGWFRGVSCSSLFFGLLHLYPPHYVVVTAIMGAALHYSFLVSRSLWIPVAMHTINNSFAALATVGAIQSQKMEAAQQQYPALFASLGVFLIVLTGITMWSARFIEKPTLGRNLIPANIDYGGQGSGVSGKLNMVTAIMTIICSLVLTVLLSG